MQQLRTIEHAFIVPVSGPERDIVQAALNALDELMKVAPTCGVCWGTGIILGEKNEPNMSCGNCLGRGIVGPWET